mmetsp:Transcript_89912/g.134739  ORF Transcript_89912/g.134739 Transcript_89912/m.134739 type:complete len:94 (+) Transcript_89912:419-700(+)
MVNHKSLDLTTWFDYPIKLDLSKPFVYAVSAAHATYPNGYVDTYITKDSWDKSKPLTFDDLENKPFCHWVPESNRTPISDRSGISDGAGKDFE